MNAHQIVARARSLPQVSSAALRLAQLLDDSANGFDEAAAIIKSDALLTAKLLRACNSSAFGLSEQIASVEQAFMLLGVNEVRRVVLALSFGKVMNAEWPGVSAEPDALWEHTLMTAAAAETLVLRGLCPDIEPAAVYTAGLLHDIGKVVMSQVISPDEQRVIANHIQAEGLDTVEAEREVLGTDHAEVGACLLYVWRIPPVVIEAVSKHHDPVINPRPRISAVVHVANRIAHLASGEGVEDRHKFVPDEPIAAAFNWSESEQEALIAAAHQSLERARELQAIA
mgnify:CR=1 FL=1